MELTSSKKQKINIKPTPSEEHRELSSRGIYLSAVLLIIPAALSLGNRSVDTPAKGTTRPKKKSSEAACITKKNLQSLAKKNPFISSKSMPMSQHVYANMNIPKQTAAIEKGSTKSD